jgi:hypothetical protein
MEELDYFKTAFQTHIVHYKFRVMCFGLTGVPHSFQKAMNSSLAPLLRKCVLVFLDDILVYGTSYQEHISHLDQVFRLLQQNQWKVKLVMCSFDQRQISYMGYVISNQGVSTYPSKMKTVADWPTPQSVKDLRSFLSLARYYRKFVKHFAIIARPLTDLIRKNSIFVWTPEQNVAFQALKNALIEALVLALPNFPKSFSIETDASGVGYEQC